jgi:hypothetical protein
MSNSVTSIGKWAFGDCSSLTSVTFEAGSDITTEWNNYAFYDGNDSGILSGTRLWNAYIAGSKPGTYTLSGNTWTQTQ